MALTDTAIRLAKAEANDRKLADSKGLYLLMTAAGSKLWPLKYRNRYSSNRHRSSTSS